MATVAHTIYSRYDPKQRETLQRDTGQLEDDSDAEDDAWQIESNLAEKRRIAAYPRFVPATASYDDWGNTFVQGSSKQTLSQSDSAGWYRSLTTGRMNDSAARADTESPPAADVADALEGTPEVPVESIKRKVEPRTKNNWFIMRAMASEPSTTPDIPPPTIADMLERDPPPLPDEAQFEPPVFLALGPSNKGFTMLQQSGWNEGEALGPHARRRGLGSVNMMEERPTKRARTTEGRLPARAQNSVKQEEIEVQCGQDADISEVRKVDVIDLTLSDLDDSDDPDDDSDAPSPSPHTDAPAASNTPAPSSSKRPRSPHSQKALLTPIPVVLKSDRLGLGLKAKTVGPYKASLKRVTHNAAALAAHIRAGEDMRNTKSQVGRGSRGFARQRKKEEESRKRLLAYLNE